jgi:hypothetical protein
MEGIEQTKVKYTHIGIHQETSLNMDLDINNERQDCKIDMGGGGGVKVMKVREYIWWTPYTYAK